jgi:NAD(P)-dependent dehydrogenase (short-subunit alcohol dehydrogenase family)
MSSSASKSAAPIILVLGAGGGVGSAVAQRFRGLGYRIALVSRSGGSSSSSSPEDKNTLAISADLTDPKVYSDIFSRVQSTFGAPPDTVVFNPALVTPPADDANIFSIPLAGLQRDLDLGVKGAYVAAGEAYKVWTAAGAEKKRRQFIYTGNALAKVVLPIPFMTSLGMTKSASHYWVEAADMFYRNQGIR